MGLGSLWSILEKISTYFPGRIEKLKNERKELQNERIFLQQKDFSASASMRIVAIDDRLREIEELLVNNAKD